jgi:hypothetical protein
MSIPIACGLELTTNSYLENRQYGQRPKEYGISLTVAEFGSDIGLIPSAYLNDEPPPGYRPCRGAPHYGLNGLALPMARRLIIDRRSAPR